MTSTKINRFLGDGVYEFDLAPQVTSLEKNLDMGIGELSQRVKASLFYHRHLVEIIRHALIGGGMSHERAARLIAVYVDSVPLMVLDAIAKEIISAVWDGRDPNPWADPTREEPEHQHEPA